MYSLTQLPLDNRLLTHLSPAFYEQVAPTPLADPYLISFNAQASALIQLDPAEAKRREFVEYFTGQRAFPATLPLATVYAGHQFGHYVPQLGDGRAILLADTQGFELQLKGAGQTPFSRHADGRAVLRSTIREYLASEAMHHLGIPTTRALCILGSQEEIYRERIETGALLVRMAQSHIRFGHFEYFFHRRRHQEVQQLADFVLQQYYPELLTSPNPYLALLQTVVERTARLIAQWQCVGFAHGVMNTDNMSILGLTLDYGPYGFLDGYDPGFICNHTDHAGRYAFDQQPRVGLWNLHCLAYPLLPLINVDDPDAAAELAQQALQSYQPCYEATFQRGMAEKLGLQTSTAADHDLIQLLWQVMRGNQVDYTLFFRRLAGVSSTSNSQDAPVRDLFIERRAFDQWMEQYRQRLRQEGRDDQERRTQMLAVNPKYILRNYMAQIAIEKAEQGDFSEIEVLLRVLQQPFAEQPEYEHYAGHPPAWAGQIVVSCSS